MKIESGIGQASIRLLTPADAEAYPSLSVSCLL